jgi:hypothetical protein
VKTPGACTKLKIYFSRFAHKKGADMHIPDGLLIIWDVVPSFQNAVSVVASQKNLILAFRKWKIHFSWVETENSLRGVPRRPKSHARV